MRVVAALGGNALLQRGEAPDADIQEKHVLRAARALTPVAIEHDLVVTHGNGPQVGVLALESALDPALSHPYPFDVLGAQTQGMIGYWLLQALGNALPGREVACLVCRTLVAAGDPAFSSPAKFVGPAYREAEARRLAAKRGWEVRQGGTAWRRVVPSPEPAELLDPPAIRRLVDDRVIVICAGGGGVPVVRDSGGRCHGVEAVVDKDLAAALLAERLDAGALLLLTDVAAVEHGYGTPCAGPIHRARAAELRGGQFAAGSMGPKVEAACRFAESTGQVAAIGRLEDAGGLLDGTRGTTVLP